MVAIADTGGSLLEVVGQLMELVPMISSSFMDG